MGNLENICGTDQRRDVACYKDSYPTEYAKSNAVAFLLLDNGTRACTAWRVGPNNYMLTNKICLADQAGVNAAEVWFGYQKDNCVTNNSVGPETVISAQNFLISDQTLDFTLFTVNNFESISNYGYLDLDARSPVIEEEIYIPQHARVNSDGSYSELKKLSIESDLNTGNICRIDQIIKDAHGINTSIGYFCDADGFTYGAPILARSSHKVIAIHQNNSCTNKGILIEKIWPLVAPYLTPTVQFESASYETNENDTTVTIVVTRAGDSTVPISVDYKITGGSAVNGIDYTAMPNGTLNWDASDSSSRSIIITLIDDDIIEESETIQFELFNFTHVDGGDLNKTTLTINDDDVFDFCSLVDTDIPYNAVLEDSILINSSSQLRDLNVSIYASSDNVGDLTFTLEHAGTHITLINRPRNDIGDCTGGHFGVILDDEAIPNIQNDCHDNSNYIWEGRYQPSEPLKIFDDKNFDGIWTLTASDHTPSDSSKLYLWCLLPEIDKETVLKVNTDATLICPGSNTNITFQMSVFEDISAAQVYLAFDPAKLQVNSVTNNSGMKLVMEQNYDNTEGYIHFAVASLTGLSPPAGALFDLFTVNVTALSGNEGKTSLYFDPDNTFTISSQGELLPQIFSDVTLALACRVPYQVNLQSRPVPPHSSWETTLTFSGDVRGVDTANDVGRGELPEALSEGDYTLCVKGTHSLRNKINFSIPLPNGSMAIDLGLLQEGDIDDNNKVDLMDFVHILIDKNACIPEEKYNAKADLNADGCIDINDAQLLADNYGKKGESCAEETETLNRRRTRQQSQDIEGITLSIPTETTLGSTFNVPIQINASTLQPVGAASAYLNFDPDMLQVNEIIPGNQLDFRLQNRFDNGSGEIDFVAVLWDNPPAVDTFILATVNVTVLVEKGEQTFMLNTTTPRQTRVTFVSNNQITETAVESTEHIAPASCQLYVLHDNSQISTVDLTENHPVKPLDFDYQSYDIQAIAIHPRTHHIYAVSGTNTQNKGKIYQLDGQSGALFQIGNTNFYDIVQLAFSREGRLWAWATEEGLIEIDLTTGQGTSVMPTQASVPLDGLTLSQEKEALFFAAVQGDLWQYDKEIAALKQGCAHLPAQTTALEMLSNDLLLLATYQEGTVDIHVLNTSNCEEVMQVPAIELGKVKDIALSMDTCIQ